MTRDAYNNNNTKAWIVVAVIAIIIIIMMYYSVIGIRDMTNKDKKRSVKKTLTDLKDRLDITKEKNNGLNKFIDDFMNNIDGIEN